MFSTRSLISTLVSLPLVVVRTVVNVALPASFAAPVLTVEVSRPVFHLVLASGGLSGWSLYAAVLPISADPFVREGEEASDGVGGMEGPGWLRGRVRPDEVELATGLTVLRRPLTSSTTLLGYASIM